MHRFLALLAAPLAFSVPSHAASRAGPLNTNLSFTQISSHCPRYPYFDRLSSLRSCGANYTTIMEHRVPQVKRIRLRSAEDIDRSLPLLLQYIKNPELASSVEELVFIRQHQRPEPPDQSCEWYEAAVQVEPLLDDDEEGQMVQTFIGQLSLGGESTAGLRKAVIDALAWRVNPTALKKRRRQLGYTVDWDYLGAAFALFIALCPNIHTISLVYEPYLHVGHFEEFLLRNNHGLLPRKYLQNLRHVRIPEESIWLLEDGRFFQQRDLFHHLRQFHRLPRLESFHAAAVQPTSEGKGWFETPYLLPGISPLRKLHIDHSELSSTSASVLIRLSKALDEVHMSTGGRMTGDGGFSMFFPKTIGKALLCHRDTLKIIDLDHDGHIFNYPPSFEDVPHQLDEHYGGPDRMEQDEYWPIDLAEASLPVWAVQLPDTRPYGNTIGSLHDFSQLTRLAIGIVMLLGDERNPAPFRLIDALPPSLESLTLRGYRRGRDAWHDENVEALLLHKGELLPRLKTIHGVDAEIPSSVFLDGDFDPPGDEEEDLSSASSEESEEIPEGYHFRVKEENGWIEI